MKKFRVAEEEGLLIRDCFENYPKSIASSLSNIESQLYNFFKLYKGCVYCKKKKEKTDSSKCPKCQSTHYDSSYSFCTTGKGGYSNVCYHCLYKDEAYYS